MLIVIVRQLVIKCRIVYLADVLSGLNFIVSLSARVGRARERSYCNPEDCRNDAEGAEKRIAILFVCCFIIESKTKEIGLECPGPNRRP